MKKYIVTGLIILLAIILTVLIVRTIQNHKSDDASAKQETEEQSVEDEAAILPDTDSPELPDKAVQEESEVYTFLQGPLSWEESAPWSGEWCYFIVNGNSFGSFGCGFCCMANIYDTLSPYEISPWDLCEYTMEVSGYEPTRKSGALDWGNMKVILKKCGFSCDVYYKREDYKEFQQQMAEAESAVVLVCSDDDDTYWADTSGHYVNIWLYNEEDDSVFLAEPGSPENNRTRIPLRYVYDAMKTASKFQYLLIDEYAEENNEWKTDGIDEIWNRPETMPEKVQNAVSEETP